MLPRYTGVHTESRSMRADPLEIGHVIGVEGDAVEVQIGVDDLHLSYHGKTYRIGRLERTSPSRWIAER